MKKCVPRVSVGRIVVVVGDEKYDSCLQQALGSGTFVACVAVWQQGRTGGGRWCAFMHLLVEGQRGVGFFLCDCEA